MLLGFISILLTVGTQYIVKICIPANFGHVMLPCKIEKKRGIDGGGDDDDNERRKLLSYAEDDILWRRALASAAKDDYCAKNVRLNNDICTYIMVLIKQLVTSNFEANLCSFFFMWKLGQSFIDFIYRSASVAHIYIRLGCVSCSLQRYHHRIGKS